MFLSRPGLLSAILASCAVSSSADFPHRRLDADHTGEQVAVVGVGNIRPEGTHALSASDVQELEEGSYEHEEGSYILVSGKINTYIVA